MSKNGANTELRGLLHSKNILNFLANLYYICSNHYTDIENLRNDETYGKIFKNYFHNFKLKLMDLMRDTDIFSTEFPRILRLLQNVEDSTHEEDLIIIWAMLKAIDSMTNNGAGTLNMMDAIWCKTSSPFEPKKYRLLFKPKNLIFDAIKTKVRADKIKTGIDIGQRIDDRLQKLIFYEGIAGRKFEFQQADTYVNRLLSDQEEKLSFAISPISNSYEYKFKRFESSEEMSYIFDEIKNRQEIIGRIDSILERCVADDVNILVFPELAIDLKLRNHISNWLKKNNTDKKIILVIAGSYHIPHNNKKGKYKYKNSCIVYRYDGDELWEQIKMNRFQVDESDIIGIKKLKDKRFQSLKKLFKETDRRGNENIEISDTLVLYDSPIGRMTVTICLDNFVPENLELLRKSQANLIFVPAMSVSLKKMKEANATLGNFSVASVFCANSCWIADGGKNDSMQTNQASYIYIPLKGKMRQLQCNADQNCLKCDLEIIRISKI